jgi:hypothetical protein
MTGYNAGSAVALKYMTLTGRWINHEKRQGYWGPLSMQEAGIRVQQAKLVALRIPDISGEWGGMAINKITQQLNDTSLVIQSLSGVRSRVLAQLHGFVSAVYYEKQFNALAESIFEKYQQDVDTLIAKEAGDVVSKIPAVMNRQSESDPESISQALTTCRRIVVAFADSIYPPSDAVVEVDGNTLKLDAGKPMNRINAYVAERTKSKSRQQKIRQNLSNLFDRVSAAVHNDVTADEARALFLNTYLFLGEVLHLSSGDLQER